MRSHIRAVVWPRDKVTEKGKTNYRYTVIGILVTDQPIAALEGKNEVVVDGAAPGLANDLASIRQYAPLFPPGDASSALCNLQHYDPPENEDE